MNVGAMKADPIQLHRERIWISVGRASGEDVEADDLPGPHARTVQPRLGEIDLVAMKAGGWGVGHTDAVRLTRLVDVAHQHVAPPLFEAETEGHPRVYRRVDRLVQPVATPRQHRSPCAHELDQRPVPGAERQYAV